MNITSIILMILKLMQINVQYWLTILQSLANQICKFHRAHSLQVNQILHNHFLVSKLYYAHSVPALYFSLNKYQKRIQIQTNLKDLCTITNILNKVSYGKIIIKRQLKKKYLCDVMCAFLNPFP